jgi:hypothetical protein
MFLDLWVYEFCVAACKLERQLSNAILICRFRTIFQALHRKRRRQSQRHGTVSISSKTKLGTEQKKIGNSRGTERVNIGRLQNSNLVYWNFLCFLMFIENVGVDLYIPENISMRIYFWIKRIYPRLENYNNFWLVKTPFIKKPYSRVLLGYITGCN